MLLADLDNASTLHVRNLYGSRPGPSGFPVWLTDDGRELSNLDIAVLWEVVSASLEEIDLLARALRRMARA